MKLETLLAEYLIIGLMLTTILRISKREKMELSILIGLVLIWPTIVIVRIFLFLERIKI